MAYDRKDDKNNPPKRWSSPHYGDGLKTTGEHPDPFGYCYQPRTFEKSGTAGFSTASSYTPHGFNPELQDPSIRGSDYGWHPYFATREEAVQWLKDKGLFGEVQKYAHHRAVDDRGPKWEFESFGRRYEWKEYHPWLTAGVTDVVTDTQDVAMTTPMGLMAGFTVHNPDGTSHPVGGTMLFPDSPSTEENTTQPEGKNMTPDEIIKRFCLKRSGTSNIWRGNRFLHGKIYADPTGDWDDYDTALKADVWDQEQPTRDGWQYIERWIDGPYRVVWVSWEHKATFTYCEGDLTLVVCRDDEAFKKELVDAEKCYGLMRFDGIPV